VGSRYLMSDLKNGSEKLHFPIVQCLYTEYPILIIYLVIEQSCWGATLNLLHYVDFGMFDPRTEYHKNYFSYRERFVYCLLNGYTERKKRRSVIWLILVVSCFLR